MAEKEMSVRRCRWVFVALLATFAMAAPQILRAADSPESVDFGRDVLPIFVKHCHECHGSNKQENGLRLDVRDAMFRGGDSGEPAVVPYDSKQSHLLQRVKNTDASSAMPPDGKRLSAADVDILRKWIDQGASWPDALAGQA
ncbi:MAG TPA: c-type cytochrome domain-containing protein, partial [Terriglobales bacterium]|nr:c-type cytochrome domain-containing protein [Terriglobales bacterium]